MVLASLAAVARLTKDQHNQSCSQGKTFMSDAQHSQRPSHGPASGFRVGQVIVRSFSVFFRNILSFVPLTLVIAIPPMLFFMLAASSFDFEMIMQAAQSDELTSAQEEALIGQATQLAWIAPIGFLLIFGASLWLSAGVTYGVVASLRGRQAGSVEIVMRSLHSVPTLMLLTLIVTLIMIPVTLIALIPFLGILVIIGLGIWAFAIFWVTVPSIVVESVGPIAGLKRSAALTKGYRWHILGIIMIWGVLSQVLGVLFNVVMSLVLTSTSVEIAVPLTIILFGLFEAVLFGLAASLAAVGYHDLRITKEGAGPEELARVFD
jgi:hypothetical protein